MLTLADLHNACTNHRDDHPGRKAPAVPASRGEATGITYQVWTRNPDGSCTCTENTHRYEPEPTNGWPIRNFYVDETGTPVQKKKPGLTEQVVRFLSRNTKLTKRCNQWLKRLKEAKRQQGMYVADPQ